MSLNEINDAMRALKQLEACNGRNEVTVGSATACSEDAHEIDTQIGMYVGPAIIVTVRVGEETISKGGRTLGSAIAAVRGVLSAMTSRELRKE